MAKIADVQEVSLEKLRPYERNAKKHGPGQIEKLKASIMEFGFLTPCLIDSEYNLIAGHGRVMAAKELGIETVPCVFIEGLTDEQRRAYILADNRLGELGEWDMELVLDELTELDDLGFDIELTGFEMPEELPEVIEDDFDESAVPDEPRTKMGDLWQLGEHRLICGDSTEPAVIDRLMDGVKADCVFTDPPYSMHYDGAGIIKETVKNVRERIKDIVDFNAFDISYLANMDVGSVYIFTSKDLIPDYFKIFDGWKFNILTWVKTNNPPMTNNVFLPDIEYLLYFHKGKRIWNNGLKPLDVYRKAYFSSRQEGHEEIGDVHPTMKPLKLISDKLRISSNENSVVLDLFGGSGSTLIACEQLNRKCYMCELDPHYCDVIISRWETLTGREAVLING